MVGMRFQMRTRLWLVSATTTRTPSVATAVGRRRELCVAGIVSVVVVKSGWPRISVARPTQAGHLVLKLNWSVGLGNIEEAPLNSRTRWFDGMAPTRLESVTKRVSAP